MRLDSVILGLFSGLLLSLPGCAGVRNTLARWDNTGPAEPEVAKDLLAESQGPAYQLQPSENTRHLARIQASVADVAKEVNPAKERQADHTVDIPGWTDPVIQTVNHEPKKIASTPPVEDDTLTIDGRTYRVELVEEIAADKPARQVKPASADSTLLTAPGPGQKFAESGDTVHPESLASNVIQLNLPTALSMVGGQHPAVGFAQWRVQEAYARLDRAKVLWLPSIQPGFSFRRHDGNYQASNGSIVDVNLNSFQYGLGAGAAGAGTTPRPGLVAQFHLADAIFQPEIAEKTAWARGHAANGVVNEQLLTVAVAYLELLDAEQDLRIIEGSRGRTSSLARLTGDFAATGQGLQADADRLQTELALVDSRLASSRERVEVASARLSQALSIDSRQRIKVLDPTVVPIDLVSQDLEKATLISTGLANRPELKEAQALVAAACEQYRRQKFAPFVPSVLLGFSTGGFGGGLGNNLNNVDGRYDFDAMMTWEIRNLGFGEGAARRETHARIEQVRFQGVRTMDRVASEISESHSQVIHRANRIAVSKKAIRSAQDSYERNLNRIRDGQGLPLEVLQSVQALEKAHRAYLKAVIEHNQAQFHLQWALGWPVSTSER